MSKGFLISFGLALSLFPVFGQSIPDTYGTNIVGNKLLKFTWSPPEPADKVVFTKVYVSTPVTVFNPVPPIKTIYVYQPTNEIDLTMVFLNLTNGVYTVNSAFVGYSAIEGDLNTNSYVFWFGNKPKQTISSFSFTKNTNSVPPTPGK